MDHAPTEQPTIQESLLAEPEATFTLRCVLRAEEPFCTISFQITRPDDSWIACEVGTSHARPADIRSKVAKMTGDGLRKLFEVVGPFG